MASQLAANMPHTPAVRSNWNVWRILAVVVGAMIVGALVLYNLEHIGEHPHPPEHAPPLWGLGVIPFVALLGAIAVLPLIPATHHWWESNLNRLGVSLTCGGLTLVYYIAVRGTEAVLPVMNHAIPVEYIPFIVLLFSLYVISGGINLKGDLAAHPLTNAGFLAFGAAIASFIGTTGASMLLIRPLLQTNAERKHVVHTVVFFIFLVSNVGGTLLPIGDPPLFLGFLLGVDFLWTLHLFTPWALCCVMLLVIYFAWDSVLYKREDRKDIARDEREKQPLRLRGVINILWLAGVVGCVATISHEKPFLGTSWTPFPFMRELLMMGFVGLSLMTTPKGVREANQFNYAAILEVAALFVGIFIAMQVPIEVLNVMGGSLGLSEPWHFFWATGSLSSVLDNAPTYVVFFETSKAMSPELYMHSVVRPDLLAGVSLGAVFMGAMTYIGNGPNFMVKAIAEQSHVRMPSFFGFVFKYSLPVLIPVFIVITILFLRPGGMYSQMAAEAESIEKPVHVDEHAVPGHGEEPLTDIPGRRGHDAATSPEEAGHDH